MHHSKMPANKKSACCKLVAAHRPLKTEPNRMHVTIGGDRLEYDGNKSTVPATLTTVKLHINSTFSTRQVRCMTADIKDFFYSTPMQNYEYGHLPLELIPDEIVKQYDLARLAVNGKVHFEIQKGMPGLKQAGIIAHERLSSHLRKHRCIQCKHTPSLWKHKHLKISFTLVADNLGIKHIGKETANHLLDALRKQYEISSDWIGQHHLGMDLKWSCESAPKHVTL